MSSVVAAAFLLTVAERLTDFLDIKVITECKVKHLFNMKGYCCYRFENI